MDADGGNLDQITDVPQPDNEPAWSPDGKKIAFTGARDGTIDVWVMDADGDNAVSLKGGGWNRNPSWFDPAFAGEFSVSPTGKYPSLWGQLKQLERALSRR
jgi:Tol biopolymer transport system component